MDYMEIYSRDSFKYYPPLLLQDPFSFLDIVKRLKGLKILCSL